MSAAGPSVGDELLRVVGADPVSVADIRRRLEVLCWDCSLHTSETVARAHGYRTVVAPSTMLVTWSMPPYWSPGDPPVWQDGAPVIAPSPAVQLCGPGQEVVATAIETDYHEPVHPGDRITAQAVLSSSVPKTTALGNGDFMVIETTYTNQRGEVVGVERMTVFRFPRGEDAR